MTPRPSPKFPLSPPELDHYWRRGVTASMIGIVYFVLCITEVPRIRFLTELKFSAFDFGLVAGLGSLAVVFQVISGFLANRIKHRKPLWWGLALGHRLLFSLVVATPLLFSGDQTRIWWIIGVLFIHDAMNQMSGPLWLSWMADLVPTEQMNRRWAQRQRAITVSTIIAAVGAALLMGYFETRGQVILGFTVIAAVGIIAGIIDLVLFARIPEPPATPHQGESLWTAIAQPLRDPSYRPFVVWGFVWFFTMMLAGPFFMIYFVKSLQMPVFTAQMLNVSAYLGVVLTSGFWAAMMDTYGYRVIMRLVLVLKSITLMGIVLTPPQPEWYVPCLTIVLFLDGTLNGALNLAWQGIMFQASPRRNRAMYIGTVNFLCIGIAGAVAPVLSGRIISAMEGWVWAIGIYAFNAYHLMFVVSIIGRFGAFHLAKTLPSARMIPMRVMLKQLYKVNLPLLNWHMFRLRAARSEVARVRAARRLGEMRAPLAISALIPSLFDESHTVREASAQALGRIGTTDAAESLARVLTDHTLDIQSPVARALGRIGDFTSLHALLTNLQRLDRRALMHTIEALGRIRDEAAILPLICLLDECDDPDLAEKIALALSRISRDTPPREIIDLMGRFPRGQGKM
ncbi:hypothetical protein CVU37_11835 [candidate division BRC1 bacterium HGW-BRC1-1]|jgi:MFS family permease|nr:MAG: hypothetical protein CVU37_11835 [candidate division BRC1 bacterium HGW-BRC1-1]